jgi:hypothetical protein
MPTSASAAEVLLCATLECAVPLWVERVRGTPWTQRIARGHELAERLMGPGGEMVMFRGKPGESAARFNDLAEAVAILSFAPGGITVFGLHFENRTPTEVEASPQS